MESREHIVEFENWCAKCQHVAASVTEDPCIECVSTPVNTDSRKPVKWEEKKKR